MSEQMTCSVCCDAYTKDTRKPVACLSCAYVACTRCVKAFLTSTPSEPNCMNCHHVWDREFLDQHLSRSWREGELKKHRAAILFDRERSLLPATQPAVEIEVQKRIYGEELPALTLQRRALREQIDVVVRTMREEIEVVDDEIARRHYYIRHGRMPGAEAVAEATKEKRKFIAACPSADCRGFLSTAYKCGTCQVQFCADCREPKSVGHTCDPALVATMAAIAKECRPCPNCGMGISKVSGCDQMYCTSCDTAYSYKTGKVVTGVIHNPHYFERLRALGGALPRQPGDVLCGGWPNWDTLPYPVRNDYMLSNLFRMGSHVQNVTLRDYPVVTAETDNRDLRVRYLMKDIDEKRFKMLIQQRDRKRQLGLEVRAPLELFVITVMEFFQDAPSPEKTPVFIEQIETHVNVPLRAIGDRYANRTPQIVIGKESIAEVGTHGLVRVEYYKPA